MIFKKNRSVYFMSILVCFLCIFSQRALASTGVYIPDPVTSFVANVKDAAYGATGDGVSDDTEAIQRAIDAVSAVGGGIVDIPAGNYMINTLYQTGNSYEKAGLVLKSNIIVRIASGATLYAIPNGEKSYQMFSITHVDNVHIIGGRLIGDRDNHIGNLGQTGYGVRITDSTNVVIEDLYAGEFWGDGVFLGENSKNITIYRVVCDHNRRQGMSIVGGQNVKILESEFKRSDGTPPKAGIDIEPEGDYPIAKDIEVRGCLFEGNATGFVVSNQYANSVAANITFADNTVRDNISGVVLVGLKGGLVTGNKVYNDQTITKNDIHWGIRLRNNGRYSTSNVRVSGNTVYGGNIIDSTGESSNTVQNNTFKASVYVLGIAHAEQTLNAKVYDGDYGDLHVHNSILVPASSISSYQWYVDGTAISGATNSSYIPTAADAGKEITVRVQYTDKAGNAEDATSSPTLPVNYANHAPTDITLNPLFIYSDEYLAEVGLLTTTDPDAGDSHTYTVDDERFEVVYGNLLRLKGENYIPFGSVNTITLNVTSTDALGASFTKAFTIEVARPKNQPPKKITLANNTLNAGSPGEIVGKLTTIDLNVGDTHTYTLSDSRFEVSSDSMLKLKDGISVDASTETSINLQVVATDSGGWVCTQNFTLQVQSETTNNTGATNNTGTNNGGAQNNGTNNGGTVNTGANNNSISTPSVPERRRGGGSGGSDSRDSGSSSHSRRSTGLKNGNTSSNSYSYIQTGVKVYNHGSWKKKGNIWRLEVDGSWAKSVWAYISDNWYLLNDRGEMVTGWANVDGRWYFMDDSGAMRSGWLKDVGGEWYYLNPISDGTKGAMHVGWHQIDNKWYYFNTVSNGTQGRMLKSQRTQDGYLLKEDGSWDESVSKE